MITRRSALLWFSAALLAACGEDKKAVKLMPVVPFDKHDRCHLCGMVIAHYDGPKAEVFLKNIDEAVKFCSVRDAFTFALQPENARRLHTFYVHDMSGDDWEKPGRFIDAKSAYYVYGSAKEGVMGVEPVPFADKNAAETFKKAQGGSILRYDEITLKRLSEDK